MIPSSIRKVKTFSLAGVAHNFKLRGKFFWFQVIFPATLLGTGEKWTLMKTISVTEYLNYEAGKFHDSCIWKCQQSFC